MNSIDLFRRSPLARHPGLLARKIASRLGVRRNSIRNSDAPVSSVAYPPSWKETLARGAIGANDSTGIDRSPRPFHRVFGHDFEEAQLLKLCREGPIRGERGLLGDIKLIWDYSRAHPLWPNAILGHFDENAAFVQRWLAANRDLNGPSWTCAMDVAIRAVNWAFSDVAAGGQISARVGAGDWAQWLWLHGLAIWRRLEVHINCNNHYLADLLGLAVVGSLFPGDSAARHWLAFAREEFPRALLAQTRDDGGLNEASARYHAFVTEMALFMRLAIDGPFNPPAEGRLRQMCQIVADLKDAAGDVFPLGDDDSGRVLWLDWDGRGGRADAALRLGACLLGQEFKPAADALHPDSGWWVRRTGDFVLAFEFGGVGQNGRGSHSHNDDFSFCLEWRGRPVIADPGTYLYTSDPAARNEFRSVRAHSTLSIDDREPRELTQEIFRLSGSDRALAGAGSGPEFRSFRREVGGQFVHQRTILFKSAAIGIEDGITGTGEHGLSWRMQFHPSIRATLQEGVTRLEVPGAGRLDIESPRGVEARLEAASHSPAYGHRQPTTALVLRTRAVLPGTYAWAIRPAAG